MGDIKFDFSLEKLIHAIALFSASKFKISRS